MIKPDLFGLTVGDAEWFDQIALAKRASAVGTNPAYQAQLEAEAFGIEALATALRDPIARDVPVLHQGRGGEIAPADDPDLPWRQRELAQTVGATPSMLEAAASLSRLNLARDANVLTLALATAQDSGAVTSTEQCLAHQFAGAHRLAMELLALASTEAQKYRLAPHLNSGALVEAARTACAASRIMDACSRSALARDRLQNGGRQTVTVQHVTVEDGGRAVVAGSVTPGDGVASPRPLTRGRQTK